MEANLTVKAHPQVSKTRRQSAVEQTSDLLKAYLERWADPFRPTQGAGDPNARSTALAMGFILPRGKTA